MTPVTFFFQKFFIDIKDIIIYFDYMSRATQINLSENKPLTENSVLRGMPSDFGSSSTSSWIYSIYADYIPVAIEGNTSVYSSSDTSANRTAVPYTMSEDGVINSISIYHNGGSGNML